MNYLSYFVVLCILVCSFVDAASLVPASSSATTNPTSSPTATAVGRVETELKLTFAAELTPEQKTLAETKVKDAALADYSGLQSNQVNVVMTLIAARRRSLLAVSYKTLITYTGLSESQVSGVADKGTATLVSDVTTQVSAVATVTVEVTKAPQAVTPSPTQSPTMQSEDSESFATHQKQFSIIASAMAISIFGFLS